MSAQKYRLLPDQGVFAPSEVHESVATIVESSAVLDAYPSAKEIDVRICKSIKEGSSLAKAHEIWKPSTFEQTDAIRGLPFREFDETCPGGLTRISIDFVEERTPGMGSFFGFKGYFMSMLANLGDLSIWDAKGVPAS